MKKVERSLSKIDDDIRSAGKTFIGLHMANMLQRIDELEDNNSKTRLIQEYFDNQVGTFDNTLCGTRTRVNSVIRIIKADKVLYALKTIGKVSTTVLPKAVEQANRTIKEIEAGKIALPVLE